MADQHPPPDPLVLIEEDAQRLYDEAPCGYLYTHPDGTLLRVNDTFLRWTGYTREEVVGRRFQDLLSVGGRIFHETHFAPLLHMQGTVTEIALDLRTRSGALLPVLVNSVQTRDASGHPVLNRTTVFNATERRRYERELQLARKRAEESARAKSELLSTISHDMRSPLGAILAAAQMLTRSPLSPPQQNYVRVLRSSSETLLSLINNVLDLGRIESGRIELEHRPFDLRQMVLDLLATLNVRAEEKGLALRVHIDEAIPRSVIGDPVKIGQILTNLVANAVKFTDRGSVAVSIRQRSLTPSRVELDFSVADTGIGIPTDRLAHIFDEYTQASYDVGATYGGSGLGLAIVRRLVALHGSRISVESVANQGSIFSFTLGFDLPADAAGSGDQGIINTHLVKDLRVLLVEDNSFESFVLSRTLAAWEVACDVSPTLDDAKATLGREPFDVVLVNVRLAADEDPAAVAVALQEASAGSGRPPAILALVPSSGGAEPIELGGAVLDVVRKPVDPSVLFAKLAAVRT